MFSTVAYYSSRDCCSAELCFKLEQSKFWITAGSLSSENLGRGTDSNVPGILTLCSGKCHQFKSCSTVFPPFNNCLLWIRLISDPEPHLIGIFKRGVTDANIHIKSCQTYSCDDFLPEVLLFATGESRREVSGVWPIPSALWAPARAQLICDLGELPPLVWALASATVFHMALKPRWALPPPNSAQGWWVGGKQKGAMAGTHPLGFRPVQKQMAPTRACTDQLVSSESTSAFPWIHPSLSSPFQAAVQFYLRWAGSTANQSQEPSHKASSLFTYAATLPLKPEFPVPPPSPSHTQGIATASASPVLYGEAVPPSFTCDWSTEALNSARNWLVAWRWHGLCKNLAKSSPIQLSYREDEWFCRSLQSKETWFTCAIRQSLWSIIF